MKETYQTEGLNMLQHGQSVHAYFLDLYYNLKHNQPLTFEWKLPEWIFTHKKLLLHNLLPLPIIREYQIFHDVDFLYNKIYNSNIMYFYKCIECDFLFETKSKASVTKWTQNKKVCVHCQAKKYLCIDCGKPNPKKILGINKIKQSRCRSCGTKSEYLSNPNKNKGSANGRYGKTLLQAMIDKHGKEKADGSLGILYNLPNGNLSIATRGSFSSDQAFKANQILATKYSNLKEYIDPQFTYLFEIIYPENRIVVNYGDYEDLVLLAVINKETGLDEALPEVFPTPIVEKYDGLKDINEILKIQDTNKEGFVILFSDGTRIKIKLEEYKRLHHILTKTSSYTIWKALKENYSLDAILEDVPDEFFTFVRKIEAGLWTEFNKIRELAAFEFKHFDNRKEMALYFSAKTYPDILFMMADGKDYSQQIWKKIKPKLEKPFMDEEL